MKREVVTFALVGGAIIATGLFLNAAGNGTFGSQVEALAKSVTQGYGV